VVAAVCSLRYWRPLGLALAPLTVGLVVSVVYGQFHYAVDAVAGLVVAALVLGAEYAYAGTRAATGGPPLAAPVLERGRG
jgi:membrane-associated phospholipid phosphatase